MPPLISIIVPVYKAEEFFPQCVESLLSQTHQNLEIILIDDGSPDNCPVMCDAYANADSRIKVIHKPNSGQSDARNQGLAIANGDFIGFVDSDDWIAPDYYEKLLQTCIQYKADIACAEVRRVKGNDVTQMVSYQQKIASKFIDKIVSQQCGSIWDKLFRRSVIYDDETFIKFPSGVYYEDNLFLLETLRAAKKLAFTKDCFYYYRFNQSSTTVSPELVDKRQRDALTVAGLIKKSFLKEWKSKRKKKALCDFIYRSFLHPISHDDQIAARRLLEIYHPSERIEIDFAGLFPILVIDRMRKQGVDFFLLFGKIPFWSWATCKTHRITNMVRRFKTKCFRMIKG
jgi:glycosyltransferase involved in cell wall biosynthesis